jgi:Ca-activated chloride channel family protein
LNLPAESRRTRFVVFLTDGAVSAEAQALEQIRKRIGTARLFVFGVGPSVNRALLSRMARLGRGRAEFLQLDEDSEGAIIRFQDSVSFPVLTGLALDWENGKAWDLYPARLPDLYEGQPLEICGRLARTAGGTTRVVLRGERNGKPVELYFFLQPPALRDQAVERVWAQARVEDLLEQQELEPARAQKIRADILALALEYNLATAYTSFVAVDQEVGRGGEKPRILHIAQPLPKGVSFDELLSQPPGVKGMVMSASIAPQAPLPPSPSTTTGVLRSMLSAPARKMVKNQVQESIAGPLPPAGLQPPAGPQDQETTLRWLARTQKLDGSWEGDIERTAAALLAFLRAGNTTRTGSFRQALRRAAGWLAEHPSPDFPGFVRAIALGELARATGSEQDRALAQIAQTALHAPVTLLEKAALGEPVQPPQAIQSLDDLRLAGIVKVHLPVSPVLFQGPLADLVKTWFAALPQA